MAFKSGLRTNWSHNQVWYPKEAFIPASLGEIQDVIAKARAAKANVRAVGSLHSFNELLVSNDFLIITDKLNKVLSIDKEALTIRVEGGIKLKDLLRELAAVGLTLPNQGYIREQSIAGATATATHGSGSTGTLSSFILQIELVDSEGKLRILNPQNDPELFEAAVVNLGSLGIVYAMTLRCVPIFKVRMDKIPIALDEVLKNLSVYRQENPFFQFFRNVYNNQVVAHFLRPTDEPVNRSFWDYLQHWAITGHALLNMNVWRPPSFLVPLGIDIFMKLIIARNRVDYNYQILSPEDEGRYIEQELAVPIEHLSESLDVIKTITDRWAKGGKRVVAINLVRFAEKDDYGFLSPTRDGPKAYLSLIAFRKKGVLNFFREIETALYQYNGRPHWGKIHFLTKDKIKTLYGANYDRFVAARAKLDPERMFSNPYVEDLFD